MLNSAQCTPCVCGALQKVHTSHAGPHAVSSGPTLLGSYGIPPSHLHLCMCSFGCMTGVVGASLVFALAGWGFFLVFALHLQPMPGISSSLVRLLQNPIGARCSYLAEKPRSHAYCPRCPFAASHCRGEECPRVMTHGGICGPGGDVDWEARRLSARQVAYAALDAW